MPFRSLFGLKPSPASAVPLDQAIPWDPWQRFDRFLVLGTEGGACHAGERDLTLEDARRSASLIKTHGLEAVERIRITSGSGRAIRPEPCLYALALAASIGSAEVRQAALGSLPIVARTASQLFTFIKMSEGMRGWGRGYRRAVAAWYTEADPEDLAHQVMRRWSREGWAHRDVLRMAHPRPATPSQKAVFSWIAGRSPEPGLPLLDAYEELQNSSDVARAADLIRTHRLPREAVPPELQSHPDIWAALLEDMPYLLMLKNLGNMTASGLIGAGTEGSRLVAARLADDSRIRIARVHPIAVLMAEASYSRGGGIGQGWKPEPQIIEALQAAFDESIASQPPLEKRILLAIDASGSMHEGTVGGSHATPAGAAACLAVSLIRREPQAQVMAIGAQYRPASVKAGWGLADCLKGLPKGGFGVMDCSLPMVHAAKARQKVDAFIVLTDTETVFRETHPRDALLRYRDASGIPARLLVAGMTSSGFQLADPEDAGMMDFVGFDAETPRALCESASC